MTTTTCTTFHNIERAKERIGLNSRNAEKKISQAFSRGKTAEEFTSWERSYLEKDAHGECVAMAYSGFCYIFNSVKSGPANTEKFIKQRYAFRLVIDDIRKKVLAVWGGDEILIEIDFIDIRSAVCLDESKIKEERHRIKIETFSGETYDFYVDIPYQFDPLPFLRSAGISISFLPVR